MANLCRMKRRDWRRSSQFWVDSGLIVSREIKLVSRFLAWPTMWSKVVSTDPVRWELLGEGGFRWILHLGDPPSPRLLCCAQRSMSRELHQGVLWVVYQFPLEVREEDRDWVQPQWVQEELRGRGACWWDSALPLNVTALGWTKMCVGRNGASLCFCSLLVCLFLLLMMGLVHRRWMKKYLVLKILSAICKLPVST